MVVRCAALLLRIERTSPEDDNSPSMARSESVLLTFFVPLNQLLEALLKFSVGGGGGEENLSGVGTAVSHNLTWGVGRVQRGLTAHAAAHL